MVEGCAFVDCKRSKRKGGGRFCALVELKGVFCLVGYIQSASTRVTTRVLPGYDDVPGYLPGYEDVLPGYDQHNQVCYAGGTPTLYWTHPLLIVCALNIRGGHFVMLVVCSQNKH
ncbi:unnamed protein product [Laminaria digitata]